MKNKIIFIISLIYCNCLFSQNKIKWININYEIINGSQNEIQILFEPFLMLGDSSILWENIWDFSDHDSSLLKSFSGLNTNDSGLVIKELPSKFILILPYDTLRLKLKINPKLYKRKIYYYYKISSQKNSFIGYLFLESISKNSRKNKNQITITNVIMK